MQQIKAQNQNSSTYDTSRVPITKAALQKALRANANDPVAIYNLLRRAQKWKQMPAAFATIKALRTQQKNNAVIAASYALAIDMLNGFYTDEILERFPFAKGDVEKRDEALQDAYRLDPKLWLTYAVDGFSKVIQGTENSAIQGRKLLEKAEDLAPKVSFVHHSLAIAYSSGNKSELYAKKIAEYEKAQKSVPVVVEASMSLFNLYDLQKPDSAKAKAAAQAVIKALPPGAKVGLKTRQRFAKYGVTVPWK